MVLAVCVDEEALAAYLHDAVERLGMWSVFESEESHVVGRLSDEHDHAVRTATPQIVKLLQELAVRVDGETSEAGSIAKLTLDHFGGLLDTCYRVDARPARIAGCDDEEPCFEPVADLPGSLGRLVSSGLG